MKTFLLLTALVLSGALGELLVAKGMRQVGAVTGHLRAMAGTLQRAGRNRYLCASLGCHGLAFGAFLGLLSYADLSFVVPVTAVSYVLKTFGARYFLQEQITPERWLGTLLVALGVAIILLPASVERLLSLYSARVWHDLLRLVPW